MIVHFERELNLKRVWRVIDNSMTVFHIGPEREAFIQKLENMHYKVRPLEKKGDHGIKILFRNDADEAAFIVQMADGLEV